MSSAASDKNYLQDKKKGARYLMLQHQPAHPNPQKTLQAGTKAPPPDRAARRLSRFSRCVKVLQSMKEQEVRCGQCQRKLAVGAFSVLQIKCPRCGTFNHLKAASLSPERPGASDPEKEMTHGQACQTPRP